MKLTPLWVALFLCSVPASPARPQQVIQGLIGKVVDPYSVPIDALIIVHPEGERTASVFRTDHAGKFEIALAVGRYDVMATARAFVPVSTKIEVIYGKASSFNPKLRADTAHMEQ